MYTPDPSAADRRPETIHALREWMKQDEMSAFIIPSTDPHSGEYVPDHYKARAYVSGFRGSAGTVVITTDRVGLWTDSRYFLAADSAIAGTEIELFRVHTPGVYDFPEWLSRELPRGSRVGVDANLVTRKWHDDVTSFLDGRGITLTGTPDPFTAIWHDRPPLPSEPIYSLDVAFTGESARARLERIRTRMAEDGACSHIISTVDDIAWTLNLRGSDVGYNPVFLAYLVIYCNSPAILYTNTARLTHDARAVLETAEVALREYDEFQQDLTAICAPVLVDPQRTSWAVTQSLEQNAQTVTTGGELRDEEIPSVVYSFQPAAEMKACKNETEIRHLRTAHVRDGVAMVRFLAWLDRAVTTGTPLDEYRMAERLSAFRTEGTDYVGDSFPYISGIDANGAIVHYSTPRTNPAPLAPPAVYLIDSGAHYRDGTTDITRTVALDRGNGNAVAARFPRVREDFTLVLKGHIALATLVFPEGTPGREIDAVARVPLWAKQRNYGHGTGHGVGFFLNVHEGPQKIAPGATDYPLKAGMLCSNEPGIYRVGQYGIRTENLVLTVHAEETGETTTDSFLRFDTVSFCPIDRRLIDPSLLTETERNWVDRYHRRVHATLAEHLAPDDRRWLDAATAPLV